MPFETGPQGWAAFESGQQARPPAGADPRMGRGPDPRAAGRPSAGPAHRGQPGRPPFETGPQSFEAGQQRRSRGIPPAGGPAGRVPFPPDPSARDRVGPPMAQGPAAASGRGSARRPAGEFADLGPATGEQPAMPREAGQPGSARSATQTLTRPAPADPARSTAPARKPKKARKAEQAAAAQQAARGQAAAGTATATAVRTPPATQPRQVGATKRRRARTLRARLALGTISVVVVGVSSFALSMHFLKHPAGPAHVLATPQKLGPFTQDPALAQGMGASALKNGILSRSNGEATNVVYAVYQEPPVKGSAGGPQIVLFIGGNLSGTTANAFISSFTGKLSGAVTTSPGSLGGAAACVPSMNGKPAECAWADNDTFGVITSPNLGATALASELRAARPLLEHPAG
ncbi:MAG TPA: hypothetical protein VGI64_09335 [Streptosporangiaceae bacterium]